MCIKRASGEKNVGVSFPGHQITTLWVNPTINYLSPESPTSPLKSPAGLCSFPLFKFEKSDSYFYDVSTTQSVSIFSKIVKSFRTTKCNPVHTATAFDVNNEDEDRQRIHFAAFSFYVLYQ